MSDLPGYRRSPLALACRTDDDYGHVAEGGAVTRVGVALSGGGHRASVWAAGLLMSPARIRPARLEFMDSLLAALRESGFSAETTYTAYHVLDAHIIGYSLWQSTHGSFPADIDLENMRPFLDRMLPAEKYPHMHEHGMQHLEEGPHRDVRTFEYALDLLLDGLERSRA